MFCDKMSLQVFTFKVLVCKSFRTRRNPKSWCILFLFHVVSFMVNCSTLNLPEAMDLPVPVFFKCWRSSHCDYPLTTGILSSAPHARKVQYRDSQGLETQSYWRDKLPKLTGFSLLKCGAGQTKSTVSSMNPRVHVSYSMQYSSNEDIWASIKVRSTMGPFIQHFNQGQMISKERIWRCWW